MATQAIELSLRSYSYVPHPSTHASNREHHPPHMHISAAQLITQGSTYTRKRSDPPSYTTARCPTPHLFPCSARREEPSPPFRVRLGGGGSVRGGSTLLGHRNGSESPRRSPRDGTKPRNEGACLCAIGGQPGGAGRSRPQKAPSAESMCAAAVCSFSATVHSWSSSEGGCWL